MNRSTATIKLELLDSSPDGKFGVTFSSGHSGRPADPTHVPTRLRRKGNQGRPMAEIYNIWGGGLLVTDGFKETVEGFELEVLQFFPIQIEQRGKVIAECYIFYICNRLDTLAKDLCVLPVAENAAFYTPAYDDNDRRMYDSARIGSHHAWRDLFSIGCMVSDALFGAIKAADFTGFGFFKYDQI